MVINKQEKINLIIKKYQDEIFEDDCLLGTAEFYETRINENGNTELIFTISWFWQDDDLDTFNSYVVEIDDNCDIIAEEMEEQIE